MLPSILQDLIMAPVHLAEGLSVKYGFFGALYRMIAPVYGLARPWCYFGEVLFLEAVIAGDRVLEIGSGTGFLTRMVAEKADVCVGLDPEPAMLKRAARRGGAARYVTGNMEALPFRTSSFDKCVCLGALHCADVQAVGEEVFSVLREGGEFLLLIEGKIIPRLAPGSDRVQVRHALEKQGFVVSEDNPVGRLYVWLRCRKPGAIPGRPVLGPAQCGTCPWH